MIASEPSVVVLVTDLRANETTRHVVTPSHPVTVPAGSVVMVTVPDPPDARLRIQVGALRL